MPRLRCSVLTLALAAVMAPGCGANNSSPLSANAASSSTSEASITTTSGSNTATTAVPTATSTPPGAAQPRLTVAQVAEARRLWPAVRDQIRTYFNWQSGPFGKAYMPVAADAYPAAQANLDVAKGEPFTVWVVRGVFADVGGIQSTNAPPSARGWWFVVRADGGVGTGFDYSDPARDAAPPSAIGQLPIAREELDLR